jgi:hypothetical protein
MKSMMFLTFLIVGTINAINSMRNMKTQCHLKKYTPIL